MPRAAGSASGWGGAPRAPIECRAAPAGAVGRVCEVTRVRGAITVVEPRRTQPSGRDGSRRRRLGRRGGHVADLARRACAAAHAPSASRESLGGGVRRWCTAAGHSGGAQWLDECRRASHASLGASGANRSAGRERAGAAAGRSACPRP
eukprot:3512509-Prymnesium_polylepis.1